MSQYKVNDYINKKWNDIYKDTPTAKAYNLGIAVGFLEYYKQVKTQIGQEKANEVCESILNGKEEFNTIFRTLVGLYNDDTHSKVDSIIEAFDKLKDVEDKYEMIREYIVKWFLLKKVLYVQYMLNKDFLTNVHEGNVRKQRNQAKINADEIAFISYSSLWRGHE